MTRAGRPLPGARGTWRRPRAHDRRAHLRLERGARAAAAAPRDARRRDPARRPAVAVGARRRRSTTSSDPAPHRHAGHPHRRHRPAGRRARRRARRRAPGARDRRASACAWRPTAPPAPIVDDIRPMAEIQQRTGVPIECCPFIGSSPIRQYAEGWTLEWLLRKTDDAITFAVREGLPVMYVTEDTTRAHPDTLRAIYRCAIRAGRVAHLRRRHRRPRDAGGAAAVVRFVASVIAEAGAPRRHRLARTSRSRPRGRQQPGGARGRRHPCPRRRARHRRARRQHADGPAARQPGAARAISSATCCRSPTTARPCRAPAACRCPTTTRWSAATPSAPPPACTPRRW